jgi:divinyl chlorophyllide a 8-vinyl-reductase
VFDGLRMPGAGVRSKRVLVFGATGTIGRAVVPALLARGHRVACLVRPRSGPGGTDEVAMRKRFDGAEVRFGGIEDTGKFLREGMADKPFDSVVSCLASRTGAPKDAWAIDHGGNLAALEAAKDAGVSQFVLLSAICVQKPLLEFQHAKLAFEKELMASGLDWTIVRPTAFFKSLSGQVERVKAGKPFLVFGDGRLTSCKPISDRDLAEFIALCLEDDTLRNRILPIGGPGPAITPLEQGEEIFRQLGRKPAIRHVPVAMLDAIIAVLSGLGMILPKLAEKAELARIGHYYATESMLVLDPASGRYDADATPSFGSELLSDHYSRLISGDEKTELGDHAVFK